MPSVVPAEDKSMPKLMNMTVRDRISDAKISYSIFRKGMIQCGTFPFNCFLTFCRLSVVICEVIFIISD